MRTIVFSAKGSLERLKGSGERFRFEPAVIDGHRFPAIIYNRKAGTVTSNGSHARPVELLGSELLGAHAEPASVRIGGEPWELGPWATAERDAKNTIQEARARALVCAVESSKAES